jgi:hypothetical protein
MRIVFFNKSGIVIPNRVLLNGCFISPFEMKKPSIIKALNSPVTKFGSEVPFFLGMGVSEIALLIGKTHTQENLPGRRKLTDLCMKYLSNFANTGNPNGDDLPHWPAWGNTEGKEKILVLDAGFDDLQLSYLKDAISIRSVIELVHSELQEPERERVLAMLDDFIPLTG